MRRLRDTSVFAVKQPWEPAAPWDQKTTVPPDYAIGMGDMGEGYQWGGSFFDDADATRSREAPPPTDAARIAQGSLNAVRSHTRRIPLMAAGTLRPLRCLHVSRARVVMLRSCSWSY